MERCVLEVYAAARPMPNGEWIAEAHLNGTVSTIRTDSRDAAVGWANARVREQGRYWDEVRRDVNPNARIFTSDTDVDGVPACLRIACYPPRMDGYAAVRLHGYDGCLAMFAYEGAFFEHPHSAAICRAEDWLRYGK